MATIKKTKKGTYETIVYIGKDENGKRKYKHITALSKKECEFQLLEYMKQPKVGVVSPVMQMSVGDCVYKYISRKEATLSPKTIREYWSYYRTSFPEICNTPLNRLTERGVQEAVDRFAETHQPKTVKSRWFLFQSAIKYYWRDFNFRIELPAVKRKRLDMPEEGDILGMLKDVEGKFMELPLYLATFCGMRRGEIGALDLDADVDYEKKFIRVSHDMVMNKNGEWVVKEPKTDAGKRNIPVPDFLLEKLKAARDENRAMPNPNTVTKWFWENKSRYGITCTFHGLRHYYVSVMTAMGIPETYQMKLVGHTTNSMLKQYQEYLKEKEVEVNEQMNGYFGSIGEKLKQG